MSNRKPKVTVGLLVYNGEKLLPTCIEASLSQTMGDFELLISDNASTDATQEIALQYAAKDKRIRYYRYPQNVGATRNFNRLMEVAEGDYFIWSAADDRMEPRFLEVCSKVLDEDPSAVIAYTWVKIIDLEGNVREIYHDKFDTTQDDVLERLRAVMIKMELVNNAYGLMRRSAIQATQLLRHELYAPDNLFIAEMAMEGKFVQVPEPLFRRAIHRKESSPSRYARLDKMMFRQDRRYTQRLPLVHLAKCHLDVIRHSKLTTAQKAAMLKEIPEIMVKRWGHLMRPELDRAIGIALHGKFGLQWGDDETQYPNSLDDRVIHYYEAAELLDDLNEAMRLFDDFPGLHLARAACLSYLGRKVEASAACLLEYARRPGQPGCVKMGQLLGCIDAEGKPTLPKA